MFSKIFAMIEKAQPAAERRSSAARTVSARRGSSSVGSRLGAAALCCAAVAGIGASSVADAAPISAAAVSRHVLWNAATASPGADSPRILLAQAGPRAAREARQQQEPAARPPIRGQSAGDAINANAVGIAGGPVTGESIVIASDLANVLDDGDRLRVVPIVSKGSAQNILDLRYLRGVDLAIVQSDVLAYFKRTQEIPDVDRSLTYVLSLFAEEVHVLARPEIRSLEDLRGKRVNVNVQGSGTYLTTTTILAALGLQVEEDTSDRPAALEKLKKGEIAALVQVGAKPTRFITGLPKDAGLKLLPIPYSPALQQVYLPSDLTATDYPNLLAEGQSLQTVAVGSVLAAYNWKRDTPQYRRVERFTHALFSNFDKLKEKPRHPKWKEVNLAASVPGWRRAPAAQEWLDRTAPTGSVPAASDRELRRQFDEFVAQQGSRPDRTQREELFKEFILWRQGRAAATPPR